MADAERRKHERIMIQMPTRMWLDEGYRIPAAGEDHSAPEPDDQN